VSKWFWMKSMLVGLTSVSGLLLGGTGVAVAAAALTPVAAGVAWLLRPPG
jgi:hypothetical protein